MNQQLPFHEIPFAPLPPAARSADPDTSYQAAKRISHRRTKAQWIAEYVEMFPGLTTGEVCEGVGFPGAWKRISDAKNQGLIVYGKPREYQGRNQQTCWPT